MIPLPDDIAPKDVNQWLSEGWFYAYTDAATDPLVVCLQKVLESTKEAIVQDTEMKQHKVPFSRMYAHWPQCGSVNIHQHAKIPPGHGKFAVHLARLQKKQWKRTYNGGCLRIRAISDEPAHMTLRTTDITTAREVFNPVYYSYSHALSALFPDGWVSVAIDPDLIVMKMPFQKLVVVQGEVAGVISDRTNAFTCFNMGLKRRLLPKLDYMVE